MDSRTKPSVMPVRAFTSAGTPAWVMLAGCSAKALGGSQAHGQLEDLKGVEEGKGAFASARHVQANHGPTSALLRFCGCPRLVPCWPSLQTTPISRFGPQQFAKVVQHVSGSALLVLDANVQGFHGTGEHPRRPRINGSSEEGAEFLDLGHDVGPAGGTAGDEVAVAAEVFGGGVQDQVGALLPADAAGWGRGRCCPP